MQKKIIALLFVFILFNCKNGETKKEFLITNTKEHELFLNKDRTININISEDVYYYSFLTQIYSENNTSYLIRQRNRTSDLGIDIIDLSTNKYIKSIKVEKEGDNGVGRLASFYYINNDSILLLNDTSVITIDSDSKVTSRKPFINSNDDYFPTVVSNKTKSFIKGDNFFFSKLSFSHPSKNDFFETNNIFSFNLKNFKGEEVPNTFFSEKHLNKCWAYSDADFYSTYNEKANELLFSFPIDDNIYKYSLASKKITEIIPSKSSYKKARVNSINCNSIRSFDEKKHNYTNFYYSFIIFDKYKNLYYRMGLLPEENYSSKNNYKNFDRKFVITILNSSMEVVGETKVLNSKLEYVYFDWFLNQEGLWISSNNPKNDLFNENTLSYTLFKLEK
tara:strand:+ start:350 stop:1522 length:1173 start_codon:yes stop_codon:yes gene_type:complete